jgi:hypothetical protein
MQYNKGFYDEISKLFERMEKTRKCKAGSPRKANHPDRSRQAEAESKAGIPKEIIKARLALLLLHIAGNAILFPHKR